MKKDYLKLFTKENLKKESCPRLYDEWDLADFDREWQKEHDDYREQEAEETDE